MATYTSNFALTKPAYGEAADIAVINGNMDEIDEIMHDNRYMMASAWDSATTYNKGDFAIYENSLYKCTTDGTSGNWDASKWTLTVLADNIGSVTVSKTASGNPIELTDAADAPMVSCETEIVGSQDLHGYDKPWVGGAGKNKLEVTGSSATVSDVTFTFNSDGTILVDGTATAEIQKNVILNWSSFPAGNYILNGCPAGLSNISLYVNPDRTQAYYDNGSGVSFSVTSEIIVRIYMANGATANNLLFKPMIRLSTESDTTFEPYSNICPITAYTEGDVVERGKNLAQSPQQGVYSFSDGTYNPNNTNYAYCRANVEQTTTYTVSIENLGQYAGIVFLGENDTFISSVNPITSPRTVTTPANCKYMIAETGGTEDPITPSTIGKVQIENGSTATTFEQYAIPYTTTFPSTIYRGSEDVAEGSVTAEWGYIASYAGESLPGEWISDRDEYAPGTTPTTGAQVAYELATPTTSTVTVSNSPIRTLSGYSHIESSTGDLEIEYITQTYEPIIKALEH